MELRHFEYFVAVAEELAGLFLGSYVGLAVPVVGLGVATLWMSMRRLIG